MRARVTEHGLLIPKELLEDVDEVEIRRERNVLVIIPIAADDPILEFGKCPIEDEISDASTHHDRYLYEL